MMLMWFFFICIHIFIYCFLERRRYVKYKVIAIFFPIIHMWWSVGECRLRFVTFCFQFLENRKSIVNKVILTKCVYIVQTVHNNPKKTELLVVTISILKSFSAKQSIPANELNAFPCNLYWKLYCNELTCVYSIDHM